MTHFENLIEKICLLENLEIALYQQGALQKEPVTTPFIERCKIDKSMELYTNYVIPILVPWWKEQWSALFVQRSEQNLLQAKLPKSKLLREYSIELQNSMSKNF